MDLILSSGKSAVHRIKENILPHFRDFDYIQAEILPRLEFGVVFILLGLINRPGVAGAVLQTPFSFIH